MGFIFCSQTIDIDNKLPKLYNPIMNNTTPQTYQPQYTEIYDAPYDISPDSKVFIRRKSLKDDMYVYNCSISLPKKGDFEVVSVDLDLGMKIENGKPIFSLLDCDKARSLKQLANWCWCFNYILSNFPQPDYHIPVWETMR